MKIRAKDENITLLENEEYFREGNELKRLSKNIQTYTSDHNTWSSRSVHRVGSKVSIATRKINKQLLTITEDLKRILVIDMSPDDFISAADDSVCKKKYRDSLLTTVVLNLVSFKNELPAVNKMLYNINERKHVSKEAKVGLGAVFHLKYRDSWDSAFYKIDNSEKSEILSANELNLVGKYIKDSGHVPVLDTLVYAGVNIPDNPTAKWMSQRVHCIADHLPVLHVSNKDQQVFVNIHELILGSGLDTFASMLEDPNRLDNIPEESEDTADEPDEISTDELLMNTVSAKPGVKPLYSRFPGLASVLLNFIQQHGYSAQEKRRTDIGTVGCTLQEILNHARKMFPGFTGSRESIRRLMYPRREGKKKIYSWS